MKLSLANRIPRDYNAATFQEIVRFLEEQSNLHAEGKLRARHGAMTAAPTIGNWEKGDFVWNSSPSATSDAQADYVVIGWMCTTSGTPGTWTQIRGLSEGITTLTLGTEVASTSGTSIDFTGIPSWAKKIVIELVGVSTNGTADLIVQLGDAGGIETTGYLCSAARILAASSGAVSLTSGLLVTGGSTDANTAKHGTVVLTLEDAAQFTWGGVAVSGSSDVARVDVAAGSKSLSAALDRVRLTTSGGTDTFDAGAINILYG